uniref:Inositol-pentakisphosphate 2-kinase IPK1 n=2 Tax=Oryza TaxID=4527 RepID=A0A0E0PF72_ORYRU
MARPRGRKRAAAAAAVAEEDSSKPEAAEAKKPAARGRGKRAKASPKPKPETEYFPEKRNLEDLWLSAFPVGTEWENIDKIKEFNWNFENLEHDIRFPVGEQKALEEGGELYGKTVYLFGSTEPQLLEVNGESKIVLIPIVVAVDCPFPPSDKIGINSVQRENEEIVPMKAMKMAWVPYVPLEDRLSRIDSLKTKIFTLGCTQRRSALRHLKTERVKLFDYCMPYYMPLNPPEDEDDTVVNIIYPLEPPIVCDFDWEMDDYEDFADEKVKDEVLPEDEKEKFKEFIKERVRERKRELKQAKEARKKAIDDMDPKVKEAFENIKFYKFYPVKTPDTPDVSNVKGRGICRFPHRRLHFHFLFLLLEDEEEIGSWRLGARCIIPPALLLRRSPEQGCRGSPRPQQLLLTACRFCVGMEVVLHEGDAKDWVYKGEGAANLILSYTGSSPSMLGKVLRVKKILKDKGQPAPNCIVFSSHEEHLWGKIPGLLESVKNDCLPQAYATIVMSQHLGANHVDGGVRVRVSKNFFELAGKNVLDNRPAWRVNASAIDAGADSALLISDHTLFSGNPRGSSCIAVEIKAKCGFLPSSEYISKENSIKKQVTRYKMHQHLKFHLGEISKTSEYDPLDLFSGSKERIHMAIKSFFSTPQNNFRIFVDGSLVFGGMGGGADSVHPNETEKCLEDLSKVTGLQLSDFIELLSEAIFKSGVLGKLLATQKLDDHDIEGAIHLYYNIISQPCLVCKSITDTELLRKYSTLHSLPLDKSEKIVRDFLISATAKDCSLMISFRPRQSGTTDSEYDSVFLDSVNQSYDYKAYFIDLDVKPLDKMVLLPSRENV